MRPDNRPEFVSLRFQDWLKRVAANLSRQPMGKRI